MGMITARPLYSPRGARPVLTMYVQGGQSEQALPNPLVMESLQSFESLGTIKKLVLRMIAFTLEAWQVGLLWCAVLCCTELFLTWEGGHLRFAVPCYRALWIWMR